VRAGHDLDPPPREADRRAGEALDHRLLRGPAAGQLLGTTGAIRELGVGERLAKEPGARAPNGGRHPLHAAGIHPDPPDHCSLSLSSVLPPTRARQASAPTGGSAGKASPLQVAPQAGFHSTVTDLARSLGWSTSVARWPA